MYNKNNCSIFKSCDQGSAMDGFLILFFAFVVFYIFIYHISKQTNADLQIRQNETVAKPAKPKPPLSPKRPEPIPEDPNIPTKLLDFLEKEQIPYLKFGKLLRLYGQVIYGIEIEWQGNIEAWQILVNVMPDIGYYPAFAAVNKVIDIAENAIAIRSRISVSDDDPREMLYLDDPSPDEIIQKAISLDKDRLQEKISSELMGREKKIAEGSYPGDVEIPENDRDPYAPSQELQDQNLIAFYPTPHSWQVPAFWSYGAIDCVPDHEEVLVTLKGWEERYGARIIFFAFKYMELMVDKAPQTKEEALRLAYEQSEFCPDLYQMQFSTPEELAGYMLEAIRWEFWWD